MDRFNNGYVKGGDLPEEFIYVAKHQPQNMSLTSKKEFVSTVLRMDDPLSTPAKVYGEFIMRSDPISQKMAQRMIESHPDKTFRTEVAKYVQSRATKANAQRIQQMKQMKQDIFPRVDPKDVKITPFQSGSIGDTFIVEYKGKKALIKSHNPNVQERYEIGKKQINELLAKKYGADAVSLEWFEAITNTIEKELDYDIERKAIQNGIKFFHDPKNGFFASSLSEFDQFIAADPKLAKKYVIQNFIEGDLLSNTFENLENRYQEMMNLRGQNNGIVDKKELNKINLVMANLQDRIANLVRVNEKNMLTSGFSHLDLHPGNIIVDIDWDTGNVKLNLIDWPNSDFMVPQVKSSIMALAMGVQSSDPQMIIDASRRSLKAGAVLSDDFINLIRIGVQSGNGFNLGDYNRLIKQFNVSLEPQFVTFAKGRFYLESIVTRYNQIYDGMNKGIVPLMKHNVDLPVNRIIFVQMSEDFLKANKGLATIAYLKSTYQAGGAKSIPEIIPAKIKKGMKIAVGALIFIPLAALTAKIIYDEFSKRQWQDFASCQMKVSSSSEVGTLCVEYRDIDESILDTLKENCLNDTGSLDAKNIMFKEEKCLEETKVYTCPLKLPEESSGIRGGDINFGTSDTYNKWKEKLSSDEVKEY